MVVKSVFYTVLDAEYNPLSQMGTEVLWKVYCTHNIAGLHYCVTTRRV